jgi:hypothetical protein
MGQHSNNSTTKHEATDTVQRNHPRNVSLSQNSWLQSVRCVLPARASVVTGAASTQGSARTLTFGTA